MDTLALIVKQIAKETGLAPKHVESVIQLLEDGNTVPFIARYRKEQTGSMDEVQIQTISERWGYIQHLNQRKDEVIRLIDEQGKLTGQLKLDIEKADKLQEVEDLYRPFKQKRKTKATIAKSKGLEPLADFIISLPRNEDIAAEARKYINEEKEVMSAEEALEGAKNILAERISDEPEYRKWIRQETFKRGTLKSAAKDAEADEKKIYEMYYEYEEPIQKIVPHRVLAVNRGEKEEILRVSVEPPADRIQAYLEKRILQHKQTSAEDVLKSAIEDGYKRLIQPSIEREIRKELTEKAEDQAIHIFAENLRKLLLQPPMKGKLVLGVDPAFRTGCKLAVVDETGKMLKIDVIYPHPPVNKKSAAIEKVKRIIEDFQIEVIAIGNGTASRETEQFIADLLKDIDRKVYYLIVNEAGASVYSASELAREEFPDLQVEERSAVSIARRLQDPLAELVKIDPKSVGVGQYQHDVSQKKLNDSLRFVVETVVNQVGVNMNTASAALLQYVAGLSKTVAANIVKKRDEIGKFTSRKELKDIPRLGAKTYEQCIGFLRVPDGGEPLDRTGIHPESYKETRELLKKLGLSTAEIGARELQDKINELNISEAAEQLGIGEITLKDICAQLTRPERDPRDEVPKPLLKTDVLQLEDLKEGMELQGTVRNVVDFGAFVDIGVKQDGLVHISKLSHSFVKHPLDVVSVGDIVTVWVEDVDAAKGRVSLSMVRDR
ncbi:RNA-binding transcriptional accessory protein [Bacillus paralicheniformis]|uniref:Tex family protein n=1 Tax=Bacillus TaxID=1386 RepID=UPI000951EDEA|nr:Tex family protein [Bacillus paralicheniformis]MSO00422.1 S1 RNA-binding domain-containing protein [Bacillus paralicheniformis]MSO04430.1 S1 RNA-binding domain-containing protein [Bacillus paralicheniformis]MSO08423.1 S1 RNA-binding domain-containing protein [Bacillus paralicheniformis]MSO12417.1 S1 RNA-binding domain-containing protein [Bacillus paralicheniformis]NJE38143.1 RNA-binding transcriptional accessory protein [Bacillus paralicheniformis]